MTTECQLVRVVFAQFETVAERVMREMEKVNTTRKRVNATGQEENDPRFVNLEFLAYTGQVSGAGLVLEPSSKNPRTFSLKYRQDVTRANLLFLPIGENLL